ncbi:MAG: TolC family protein [Candidatus Hydrogenedentes bacterium]|nr:TolC family protein [Candidatus Hydrogenedentota bacterium]
MLFEEQKRSSGFIAALHGFMKRLLASAVFITSLLPALNGCITHQPDTNPLPLFDVPATFSMAPDDAAPPMDAWWTVFDDSELDSLVDMAMAQNFTLAEGLSRIEQSQALLRQFKAVRKPQIDAATSFERRYERELETRPASGSGSGSSSQGSSSSSNSGGSGGSGAKNAKSIWSKQQTADYQGAQNAEDESSGNSRLSPNPDESKPDKDSYETQITAGIALTWELDLWGRLKSVVRAERAELAALQEDYRALRLFLSAQVAEAYYQAVEQRMQYALLMEQRSLAETFLELLELRFLQGSATGVDLLQQRGQLAEIDAEVPVVQSELGLLENRLDVLVGMPPDGRDRTNGVVLALPESARLPELGVPLELLRNRPDLQALQHRVVASDYDVTAAIAERLPRVTLDGSLVYTDGTNIPRLTGAGSMALFQPLLDWGLRKAAVDASRETLAQNLLAFTETYLVAIEEVETALWQEARQRERIDALASREEILMRTVEETRQRYSLGVSDYLPVITALEALQNVQRNLLQERRALVSLRIQIYRAIGGATGQPMNTARAAPSPRQELFPPVTVEELNSP